jgi:hypothetical protein
MSFVPAARCGSCGQFRNAAAYLEAMLPGLGSLSSGHGSVRSEDGHCLHHDRLVPARGSCEAFVAAACG